MTFCWALRGGGGNFGVVTSFTFRLSPVGTIVAGPTLWPLERAAEILRWYREFMHEQPDELNGFFAFLTIPPAPPFPEHLHFQKMCARRLVLHRLDEDEAGELFEPVRALAPELRRRHELAVPSPATPLFDGLYPPGDQWYWRADFVAEIPDEAVAVHAEFGGSLPT